LTRKRCAAADLGASWKEHAEPWVIWARKPGHDSYWRFHRDLFLASVPAAGRKTLDVGCGEGRLSRDLKALGHDVVGVDISPTMLEAAQHADEQIETHLADAAELPFRDAAFDCVVAFMSLQDIDDLRGATEKFNASSNLAAVSASRSCTHLTQPAASRAMRWTADSSLAVRTSRSRSMKTTSFAMALK